MGYLYILLAVLLLLIYMRFEAGFLKVKRIYFTKNREYLKIAHLSDIHINRLKVPPVKISRVLTEENPDLIIITGDYVEKAKEADDFLSFLEEIRQDFKILLCLGNHDYEAFARDEAGLQNFISAIKSKGVYVLHNKSICFEKNSKKYNIIGIDDVRWGRSDVNKALKSCCSDVYMNIAFSHNPDVIFDIPRNTVDYLFCGHFHGGQIWVPFDMEFKILRKEKLCKMGIKRGLHRLNGITLYINKGLGNVVFPLRFLSRPEISIYYLP